MIRFLFILFLFGIPIYLSAQLKSVPYDHVITDDELIQLLNDSDQELKSLKNDYTNGKKEKALNKLTLYFKEVFAERYFFNWKNFDKKLKDYNSSYSKRFEYHKKNASKHLELYPSNVRWKLPFKNLKNKTVSSYPYRHLTRQQRAGDIALLYYYTKENKYLTYIPEQAKSLNDAFDSKEVETIKDGNGAYESFRAGKRMASWLFVHNILLASEDYTPEQQIVLIKSFLHTGAKIYHHNQKFHEGNHQTKGLSSLMMLSILFQDITGTDLWLNKSKELLEEHMEKEIYPDGFQFERSVHYHMSDIRNYLLPYLLAKKNNIELSHAWDQNIEGLFTMFLKLSLPNKKAPVLQDDTDSPWAEFNEISEIMALGSAIFNNTEFKHFASDKISKNDFWYLSTDQIDNFIKIKSKKPEVSSAEFPSTGYYIMRNGWNKDDLYMVISAGLTSEKPDHQHGDMLGIQAYAYGNMVLPNYQVRYYLTDLEFFKNSWVKNVALVDSNLQGKEWKGNKGGSGFGKFKKLPVPKVFAWKKFPELDLFIGEHNGFKELGYSYLRQVIFIKDGFWIVQDHFFSETNKGKFQQVWQGHYDSEKEQQHYRSVFQNGAGLDIIQLGDQSQIINKSSFRGKGNLVFQSDEKSKFTFTTLLYPFKDFDDRINETKKEKSLKLRGWKIEKAPYIDDKETDAGVKLSRDNQMILLKASYFTIGKSKLSVLNSKTDLYIIKDEKNFEITNCGFNDVVINFNKKNIPLVQGETKTINF